MVCTKSSHSAFLGSPHLNVKSLLNNGVPIGLVFGFQRPGDAPESTLRAGLSASQDSDNVLILKWDRKAGIGRCVQAGRKISDGKTTLSAAVQGVRKVCVCVWFLGRGSDVYRCVQTVLINTPLLSGAGAQGKSALGRRSEKTHAEQSHSHSLKPARIPAVRNRRGDTSR